MLSAKKNFHTYATHIWSRFWEIFNYVSSIKSYDTMTPHIRSFSKQKLKKTLVSSISLTFYFKVVQLKSLLDYDTIIWSLHLDVILRPSVRRATPAVVYIEKNLLQSSIKPTPEGPPAAYGDTTAFYRPQDVELGRWYAPL